MAEEFDLNKLRAQAPQRREQQPKPTESREELSRKADESDARKEAFAALSPDAQLAEAQAAGYDSLEEYVREQGLGRTDPNIHRLRLAARDEKSE